MYTCDRDLDQVRSIAGGRLLLEQYLNYPGPALSGHCIALDPFHLTWTARGYGQRTRFLELACEVSVYCEPSAHIVKA